MRRKRTADQQTATSYEVTEQTRVLLEQLDKTVDELAEFTQRLSAEARRRTEQENTS